jgi:hypothetical protein
MDARQIFQREPSDAIMYNNWPSQTAVREKMKTAANQRSSLQRLCGSPNRVSPMRKYVEGLATFNKNPAEKANRFLQSRCSEQRMALRASQKQTQHEFVTPMKLRKIGAATSMGVRPNLNDDM